jgi:hypothetical protein
MNMTRLFGLAALGMPAVLAGQQPALANPFTQSFKGSATQYVRWLTAAFDSIPASKYGYKPTPMQQTIGYIAQHLENANYQLCGFGATKPTFTSKDSLADTVKAKWPKDTLVARLKASFVFCDNAIATLGPPAAGRMSPRARFVLVYVTDLVDHWSQIANYMRLNGMIPPSALPRPSGGN